MIQTEWEFTLPRGYLDASGHIQGRGRMRLATALDEVLVVNDPRAQENEAYAAILLLSRVITQLGELAAIRPEVVEGLFAADLAYLEDLYLRINSPERLTVSARCPHCDRAFLLQVAPLAEEAGGQPNG